MMKRWISTILIGLLMLSNISLTLPSVYADSSDSLANGVYEIPFEVWQENKDEVSVADSYFEKPARLTVKDGVYTVGATLKNASWWEYFRVNRNGEFVDVIEVSHDKSEDLSDVEFVLDDLDEIVDAKVHIVVKGIPGFTYDNEYKIRLKFDSQQMEVIELEDLTDEEEVLDSEDEVVEEEKEETSENEDVAEEEGEESSENEGAEGEETSGSEDVVDEETPSNSNNSSKKDNEDSDNKNTNEEEKVAKGKYKNGTYDLPFIVWQENKDEVSVADSYFKKPAKLIVKDGVYTVRATLKNASWWEYFKVKQSGKFIDVTEISNNKSKDESVVEFVVDDLDKIVDAKVHIIVKGIPGFSYDNKYNIRLKFDPSMVELNEKEQSKPIDEDKNQVLDNEKPGSHNNNNTSKLENDSNKNVSSERICRDGIYNLPFKVLKADEDVLSVADEYFEKPAKLIVKNGTFTVEAVLKNASWWQYFKVASKQGFVDVKTIEENKKDDTRVVQFEVDNPNEILDAKIHIIVTGIPGFDYDNKYDIRLQFDTSKIPLDGCEFGEANTKLMDKRQDGDSSELPINHGELLNFDRHDDYKNSVAKSNEDVENPKTADTTQIRFFMGLLIASLIPLLLKAYQKVKAIKGM